MKLVGITGKAGAGKDTVAQALVKIGFVQWMFAMPLKMGICSIFDVTPDQVQGSTPELRAAREKNMPGFNFSLRKAMQTLGTEWGRNLDPEIWVKLAEQQLAKLDALKEPPIGMVISDVRFENEANWVRENGGEVWHIERPGVQSVETHASEAGVLRHHKDIVLRNVGTAAGIQRAAQIIAVGE